MIPTMSVPSDEDWLRLTVKMEAEGEPYEGMVAVAFCIMNRVRKHARSVADTVLRQYQFSAWNTDSPTRMRLDTIKPTSENWYYVCSACAEAFYAPVTGRIDPIEGRTLYMNEEVVLNSRSGSLPEWWKRAGGIDPGMKIGAHTFRYDI